LEKRSGFIVLKSCDDQRALRDTWKKCNSDSSPNKKVF